MAFDVAGPKKGLRPTMNVTPLVDVVLVLLIIFMVVTPLLTKQVWLDVPPKPKADAPPPPPEALVPIVVSLDAAGVVAVNGEVVPEPELVGRVTRMVAARAEKVVFFDAHHALPYERAVEVMDKLKGGGVPAVAVLAEALPE